MANVPLSVPFLDEREASAVLEVLKSGYLVNGPKVKIFEEQFARFLGVNNAISYNSCASALQAVLEAAKSLDHTGRNKVVVPSFTFSASANAILRAGLVPHFVDVDSKTMNMDINSLEGVIDSSTFAIMPVHYAGQPCNMDAIIGIATKHNLVVVEDSAETLGASFNGKQAGTFGYGCFSFYPTKNMTTTEGGMVVTNDDRVLDYLRSIKGHGISISYDDRRGSEKWKRSAVMPGFNFRMSDLSAAIGLVQLEKLPQMNRLRQEHAARFNETLMGLPLDTPYVDSRATHVYQMYVIKLHTNLDRSVFVRFLNDSGIGASVHFDPPLHIQPAYQKYFVDGTLSVTEDLAQRIVTLPMYPSLNDENIRYVSENVIKACKFSEKKL